MLTRRKLEIDDLTYAAAALDCEGSISLSRSIDKRGWHHCDVVVSIANTNVILVEFLKSTFGGRIHSESPKGLAKRLIYRWKISSLQAAGFLKLVLPYMKLKVAQADLAITYQSERDCLDNTAKDIYWQTMKALNRGEAPAETKRENAESNRRSDSPTLVETPVSA